MGNCQRIFYVQIEDIDAPSLTETRATINDGYFKVVSYTTETTGANGGAYATGSSLRVP